MFDKYTHTLLCDNKIKSYSPFGGFNTTKDNMTNERLTFCVQLCSGKDGGDTRQFVLLSFLSTYLSCISSHVVLFTDRRRRYKHEDKTDTQSTYITYSKQGKTFYLPMTAVLLDFFRWATFVFSSPDSNYSTPCC